MFFKISVLKNFANFSGKHLCWNIFLIKLLALRPATLFKTGSKTCVFFVTFAKFDEHILYMTPIFHWLLLNEAIVKRIMKEHSRADSGNKINIQIILIDQMVEEL